MFDLLLFNLRSQSVKVGVGEWLVFLKGIRQGLVVDLDGLYHFGRSILVQSEAQFVAWDIAFDATFAGVELPPGCQRPCSLGSRMRKRPALRWLRSTWTLTSFVASSTSG